MTAIITAIITIIIMYVLCIKHNKQSGVPPSDYETPVETSTGLEMKSNTAYGQVIHTLTDKLRHTPPAVSVYANRIRNNYIDLVIFFRCHWLN